MIIDFSAHDKWDFCPGAWYELYVNKRRKRWPKAQRDDALALGSLVHEGMRIWQQQHTVCVPQTVIDEVTPTPELLGQAQELIYGYTRAYPEERWPLVSCEEPLTMPLGRFVPTSFDPCPPCEDLTLLAKIDTYFYVPELTTIESGVPGITFTLCPGWWIHEYKTKSPRIPIGIYMQSWEMGMQASYQTLALQHHINGVQGLLVNVLEKPERPVPKRTCKPCGEAIELYRWLPTGIGQYACPQCGTRRKIDPPKADIPQTPPSYYRILVTREQEQLAADKAMIIQTGQEMIRMQAEGLHSVPWHKKNCVDLWWKRPCDYYSAHRNGNDTRDDDFAYMDAPEYRGLVQIAEAL